MNFMTRKSRRGMMDRLLSYFRPKFELLCAREYYTYLKIIIIIEIHNNIVNSYWISQWQICPLLGYSIAAIASQST